MFGLCFPHFISPGILSQVITPLFVMHIKEEKTEVVSGCKLLVEGNSSPQSTRRFFLITIILAMFGHWIEPNVSFH